MNGVEIEVRRFDLRTQALPWLEQDAESDPADGRRDRSWWWRTCCVPCCSIWRAGCVVSPAHLLAGGLLKEQVDEVVEAFGERLGMRERERRERGEWAVVWLRPVRREDQRRSGSSVAARMLAR